MTEARMQIKNRLESSGLDRSISGNIFVASAVRKLSRATPRIISRPVIHLAPSNLSLIAFFVTSFHFIRPAPPILIGRRRFHPGRRKILDERNLRCSFRNSKFHSPANNNFRIKNRGKNPLREE